ADVLLALRGVTARAARVVAQIGHQFLADRVGERLGAGAGPATGRSQLGQLGLDQVGHLVGIAARVVPVAAQPVEIDRGGGGHVGVQLTVGPQGVVGTAAATVMCVHSSF